MERDVLKWCREVLPDLDVERQLGAGGMGIVLLGTQRRLKRKVAIKVLPAAPVSRDEQLRFQREARTYAALSHPNLVKVFDADLAGDAAYIVLEYLEGCDLRQWLVTGVPMDVRPFGRDLSSALAYIHDRGILHRDIKPANVFLCGEGPRPVLVDFGLAKATASDVTQLTRQGEVVGTPAYMAPEVLLGGPAGPAADVYGLGLVFYEVVARRVVFVAAGTGVGVSDRIVGKIPPFVSIGVRADPELEKLIMRCVSTDPAERPTAAELTERFDAMVPRSKPDRPLFAPGPGASPTLPMTRPPRDRRALGALALGIAAILWLGALGLRALSRPEPRHPGDTPDPRHSGDTPDPGPSWNVLQPSTASLAPSPLAPWTGGASPAPAPSALPASVVARDGSTMLLIPRGAFRREAGPGRDAATLELDAYYVDRDEVTNAQYAAFEADTRRTGRQRYAATSPDLDLHDHPVNGVDFADAEDYCRWAGKQLPDEDQWEKAARGREPRLYPWGDALPPRPAANYRDRAAAIADARRKGREADPLAMMRPDDGFAFTAPVGRYPAGASPCGARDMVGNVWEWCQGGTGDMKPTRGGSFRDNLGVGDVRCAGRELRRASERHPIIGFRGIRLARAQRSSM